MSLSISASYVVVIIREVFKVQLFLGVIFNYLFIDVGPVKAYKLIKEVSTIENVLIEIAKQNAQIDKSAKKKRRYLVPE